LLEEDSVSVEVIGVKCARVHSNQFARAIAEHSRERGITLHDPPVERAGADALHGTLEHCPEPRLTTAQHGANFRAPDFPECRENQVSIPRAETCAANPDPQFFAVCPADNPLACRMRTLKVRLSVRQFAAEQSMGKELIDRM